eukprot:1571399-Amphidinium_carterae.1
MCLFGSLLSCDMCLCTNPSCYTSTLVARVVQGKVSEASKAPWRWKCSCNAGAERGQCSA